MAGSWNGTQYTGDSSPENVVGTAADEQIWTFLGNDVIRGNGGNDTIDSGMESDKVFGGTGNDLLYDLNSFDSSFTGLVGKDTLFGGDGNDTLWFNSVDSSDIGDGGAGIDTLVIRFDFLGGSTLLPVTFALGPTTACYVNGILGLSALNFEQVDITASGGDDILTGGVRGDTLHGGAGNDTLSGLGGDDLIDVGTGNFAAFGGAGRDTLVLDLSQDFTAITLKLDGHFTVNTAQTVGTADGFEIFAVTTGGLDDRLTGGAFNDSLNGGNGADDLFGAAGDDLLTLGEGAGRAYGGDGNDRITYSNSVFSLTPDPGDHAEGGAGNDSISFAKGGDNTAYGGAGDDGIGVAWDNSTLGTVNHFYGGDGNDSVGGGNGADHLFGGAGNDVLSGYPRVQEMQGGQGNDTFIVNGSTSDPVPVGQVLNGGLGFDRLNWTGQMGGAVDLTTGAYTTTQGAQLLGFEAFGLYLEILSDLTMTFGSGDDRLDGGNTVHDVTAFGGQGHDTLITRSSGAVVLTGGGGGDHLTANGGASAQLSGGLGNDFLAISTTGQSTLDGGIGTDIAVFNSGVVASLTLDTAVINGVTHVLTGIEGLAGSFGNDTLTGDSGANQIHGGGGGADLVTTGGGADTIILTPFQSGTTHVTDFNHALDTIGLSGFGLGVDALPNGPLAAGRLVTGSFAAAPTATVVGPQLFYDQTLGNLWLDRDGTGVAAAVLVLVLDNHPLINLSDLIVGDYLIR